ncbi:hypothetical protein [Streptomyces sp. M92]|uniref:hypothetical protein n=1 Tax=Streptomyces sp. M92 TaxID=2944250 RepID=UPI003FA7723B
MAWSLGPGITGVVPLALSLVFGGVLEGAFGGALDGFLEGWLSLPVTAGFTAVTGFAGADVLGTGWTGPGTRTAVGRPLRSPGRASPAAGRR